jgi:hypothetical protein
MIARHEAVADGRDIWAALAAPLGEGSGPAVVRQRLDLVVPGEWDATFDLLPTLGDTVAFKCRIQILGVIREHVGAGADYRAAASAAFVAAAAMFGIRAGRPAAAEDADPRAVIQRTESERPDGSVGLTVLEAAETRDAPPAACAKCGSERGFYDNRADKASGKVKGTFPDFRCKDCRAGVWADRRETATVGG